MQNKTLSKMAEEKNKGFEKLEVVDNVLDKISEDVNEIYAKTEEMLGKCSHIEKQLKNIERNASPRNHWQLKNVAFLLIVGTIVALILKCFSF